jgi:hypothetical protein
MHGNQILISSNPKGHFFEGILDSSLTGDQLKPGRILRKKKSVAPIGGRFTYLDALPGTDGEAIVVVVLLDDPNGGRIATTAYTAGRQAPMYIPAPGDELNLQATEGAGTSNSVAIGDLFMIDSDAGVLVPWIAYPKGPVFESCEVLTSVAADTLLWVSVGN